MCVCVCVCACLYVTLLAKCKVRLDMRGPQMLRPRLLQRVFFVLEVQFDESGPAHATKEMM